jgi:hypothetical protein
MFIIRHQYSSNSTSDMSGVLDMKCPIFTIFAYNIVPNLDGGVTLR